MEELEKQIRILKKYNISNYIVENNQIVINGYLDLKRLDQCNKELLKNVIINGDVLLNCLTYIDKDFLFNTIINGRLNLDGIKKSHKDFLKNTIINGDLHLWGLKSCDKDFLFNTIINGKVDLLWLSQKDSDMLESNLNKSPEGFNKERNILYVDGKISRVYSFYEKDNYIIYKTSSGTIHQRNIISDNEIISKFYS